MAVAPSSNYYSGMTRADEYRQRADELEREASRSPCDTEEYARLARHWRELADAAERDAQRGY